MAEIPPLIKAFSNNDKDGFLSLLDRDDTNVDAQEERYGNTALHLSVINRNVNFVERLLSREARTDIENHEGQTAKDLSRQFHHQDIFDLFHPELTEEKRRKVQEANEQKCLYELNLNFSYDVVEKTLIDIADQYFCQDKVPADLDRTKALKYIINAIQYMTLHLLNSRIYFTRTDRYNGWAERMLKVISACAVFFKSSGCGIFSSYRTCLSLYPRHSQYNPDFISNLSTKCKMRLTYDCLHSLLDSGELEKWRKSLKDYQNDISLEIRFPGELFALLAFLSDEYHVQYIEDAVLSCERYDYLEHKDGRARCLYNLIKLGEALVKSSPKIRNSFDRVMVLRTIAVRHFVCHPEKAGHSPSIKCFLNNAHFKEFVINGTSVDLKELADYWSCQKNAIKELGDLYRLSRKKKSSEMWKEVAQYTRPDAFQEDEPKRNDKTKHFSDIKKDFEGKLSRAKEERDKRALEEERTVKINEKLRSLENKEQKSLHDIDEICCIKEFQMNIEIENYQREFVEWLANKGSKRPSNGQLNNPKTTIENLSKILTENEANYSEAKRKEASGVTLYFDEKKLLVDYRKITRIRDRWLSLENDIDLIRERKRKLSTESDDLKKRRLLSTLDDYLFYAREAQRHFEKLKDFKNVDSTSRRHNSRGFGGHPDHDVLKLYQVLIGSLDRWYAERLSVKGRHFNAHIGVRQVGTAQSSAIETSQVFFSNSKQIIARIPALEVSFRNFLRADLSGVPISSIRRVLGDRNCMYDAVLKGIEHLRNIERNLKSISAIRKRVADEINLNLDEFRDVISTRIFAAIRNRDLSGFQGALLISMNLLIDEIENSFETDSEMVEQKMQQFIIDKMLVEQYVEMIGEDGAWCGRVELTVLSRIIGVQLLVHKTSGTEPSTKQFGKFGSPIVHLDYDGIHYELQTVKLGQSA